MWKGGSSPVRGPRHISLCNTQQGGTSRQHPDICKEGRKAPTACRPRQVSQEGDPVEETGLKEALTGPWPSLQPMTSGQTAALSRSVCGDCDPGSLPGPVSVPVLRPLLSQREAGQSLHRVTCGEPH